LHKNYWSLLLLLFVTNSLLAQDSFDFFKKELDQTLANETVYQNKKNSAINQLKNRLRSASSNEIRYLLNEKLYEEYKSYQSDSALVYAKRSLQTAHKNRNSNQVNKAQLNLASILGTLGMYNQSLEILNTMEPSVALQLKGELYWTKRVVYGGLIGYANGIDEKNKYTLLANRYRDLAIAHLSKKSTEFILATSGQLLSQKKPDQAIALLLPYFETIEKSDPNRAVIAYLISENYKAKKEKEQEKKWLAISAISDLELVKKENISLRELAFLLYEEGDIESAYEYIKRSLDDAVFCNSRLRTYEISKMLPIINETYEAKNKSAKKQLIVFLVSASVLALFLLGVLILLFKQMKKLAKAQKNVELANNQLSELNQQLQGFNSKLNQTNLELAETSLLKEIYIGRYMDQCSVYIGKMEEYSQKLKVMATAGKVNDLVSTVKSKAFIDKELKEFYSQFDQTFVQLFPTFVSEFKYLLNEPEAIIIKKGEVLNPELRLFALIRLGIKDSAKIAEFLRYSASTIYNYRSQIKNKAKGPRELFELKVMGIGSTNKEVN
jgi:DNA-binding CsgD family transcriptional regulator